MIKTSEEITHRDHFGRLCRHRGLIAEAMEVGVDQGFFSKQFMTQWDGGMLYLVDPYLPYEEMAGSRTADMMVAVAVMLPFHGRFKFYLMESQEAAASLPPRIRPQFIYIDADHSYKQVKKDIRLWWERLPPDGILAGHDYDDDHPGVIQAVNEFAEARSLTVRLTVEDSVPSWYIYKTEPDDFEMLIK